MKNLKRTVTALGSPFKKKKLLSKDEEYQLVSYSDFFDIENTMEFDWYSVYNEDNLEIISSFLYTEKFSKKEHLNFIGKHNTDGPLLLSFLTKKKKNGYKCFIRTVADDYEVYLNTDKLPKKTKDIKRWLSRDIEMFSNQVKLKKLKPSSVEDFVKLEKRLVR